MKAKKRSSKSQKTVIKGLSNEQIDQALRHLLTSTLALYVLKNSKRKAASIIDDLMGMEINAAQLVGLVLQLQASGVSAPKLETTLAGVCSFIPFGAARAEAKPASRQKP